MGLSTNSLYSQNPTPQQTVKMLKPQVVAGDLIFAYQLLNTIELRGSEVDALLEIKAALLPYIEKIQKDNIPLTNLVLYEINPGIAQNLLLFMERGKFIGADAERYKRFVISLNESMKPQKVN
jgi:hypothetical protein